MGPVDRLRAAVSLFSERADADRVIMLRGEPLTWGDLRAILALVEAQGHTPGHCPYSGHCPVCDQN